MLSHLVLFGLWSAEGCAREAALRLGNDHPVLLDYDPLRAMFVDAAARGIRFLSLFELCRRFSDRIPWMRDCVVSARILVL